MCVICPTYHTIEICDLCPTVSSCFHPYHPIPMLLSPYSHPNAPIPTSSPRTPIIMIGMLLNLSCGVVMLLEGEHGDGSVDKALLPVILSPPSCPNTSNAVLSSHLVTPP